METKVLLEDIIYPNLDIENLIPELSPIKKNSYYHLICPSCNKKEAYIPNKTKLIPVIICNRQNKCGIKISIFRYIKESRNLSNKETLYLLAENANIELKKYNFRNRNYKTKHSIQNTKLIIEKTKLTTNVDKKILNINYLIKNFQNLKEVEQFMTIVTLIYNFSLQTNQINKINYYKSRKIKAPNNIGTLNKSDFNKLENFLLSKIPLFYLQKFNIFKENRFKFNFSDFSVIPSFDIFTNLISAIRLRNLKKSKIKEIEISFSRIASPLPYPLTIEKLNNFKELYFTEGHIDALSLNIENVVGIEGVNSLDDNKLYLFQNKIIYIAFDQDETGIKSSKKLSNKLNELNIKNYIIRFEKYKDINEIVQNNENPFSLFKIM